MKYTSLYHIEEELSTRCSGHLNLQQPCKSPYFLPTLLTKYSLEKVDFGRDGCWRITPPYKKH